MENQIVENRCMACANYAQSIGLITITEECRKCENHSNFQPTNYVTVTQVIAPPIDMSKYLEEGEVDITNIKKEDVVTSLSYSEIKALYKRVRIYQLGPVAIFLTGFFKKGAYEARSYVFDTKDEMLDYIKKNWKKIVIYQVIFNKLSGKWNVRHFSVKINWFMLKYMEWKFWRIKLHF